MTAPPYQAIRMLMHDRAELGHGWPELLKPAPPAAGAAFTRTVPNHVWELHRAVSFQLVTGAAAGQRQPVINYLDADGFTVDQVIAGAQIGPSTTAQTFMNDHTPTSSTLGQSTEANGVVNGPLAAQAIASAALAAGEYTVNWRVALGGTTAATDGDNFQLVLGSTVLLTSENGSSSGTDVQQDPVTIEVPSGGATLAIQAINAGTGTASYRAQFTAIPAGSLTYFGALPQLILRPGWALQVAVTGIQAADQLSAVGLLAQRYPSDWAGGTEYRDEVQAWLDEQDRLRAGV